MYGLKEMVFGLWLVQVGVEMAGWVRRTRTDALRESSQGRWFVAYLPVREPFCLTLLLFWKQCGSD